MPDGWVLCYSKQHDRAYFFFGREGRSTWDFPGVHEDLKGDEYALDGYDDADTVNAAKHAIEE